MFDPPAFDPPFDSPLEHDFAWQITKYLHADVRFYKQVSVDTICGRFRIDFVAHRSGGLRVGLECDGADFHDSARDEWRDAMILGAGAVDSMARIRGSDFTHHAHDVLLVLSRWYPQLFSARGVRNVQRVASAEALSSAEPDSFREIILYPGEPSQFGPASRMFHINVERSEHALGRRKLSFSKDVYEFARACGGGNLDQMITRHRNKQTERGSNAERTKVGCGEAAISSEGSQIGFPAESSSKAE